MTMNWKQLEVKVLNVIRAAAKQYSEKWVTAETLSEHIETLNPNWLKRYGSCFNRTRVEWIDKEGQQHTGSWLYPLHEIQEMLEDGRIKQLDCRR
jgi:hypothetical protein